MVMARPTAAVDPKPPKAKMTRLPIKGLLGHREADIISTMKSLQLNVITHLHTKASNGPASSLDQMARSILTDVFGTVPEDVVWRECFTDADDIREILVGKRTKLPIDILFLTDHVSARYHRLDGELLQLAAEDRRVGLGCEIQTVHFSEKRGTFCTAPEVLVYGDGEDRCFHGRPYTGIDDQLLERLYDECMVPGSPEPEIVRVRDFCRENRIACALAHPFDCHQLDLDETLDIIGRFTFIETVNGGFPRRSAEALQEYADFHNDVIVRDLGGFLQDIGCSHEQKLRINKIVRSQLLVGMGGSDAHLNNFDRVVTRFRTEEGRADAADFVRVMLRRSAREILSGDLFQPYGRGISMAGLYLDVGGIVMRNIQTYRHHFNRSGIWLSLIRALLGTGWKELKVRIVRNRSIAREYRRCLGIETLEHVIDVGGREARIPALATSGTDQGRPM